jgi:hypothetical protein
MLKILDNFLHPLKGWRTLAISLGLTVAGALQSADWATLVEPADVGPVLLGLGAVVGVLRAITNTPLGSKEA